MTLWQTTMFETKKTVTKVDEELRHKQQHTTGTTWNHKKGRDEVEQWNTQRHQNKRCHDGRRILQQKENSKQFNDKPRNTPHQNRRRMENVRNTTYNDKKHTTKEQQLLRQEEHYGEDKKKRREAYPATKITNSTKNHGRQLFERMKRETTVKQQTRSLGKPRHTYKSEEQQEGRIEDEQLQRKYTFKMVQWQCLCFRASSGHSDGMRTNTHKP